MHRIVLLFLVSVAFLVSSCGTYNLDAKSSSPTIKQALDACKPFVGGTVHLGPEKKSLLIVMSTDTMAKPSIQDISCLLKAVGAPEIKIKEIASAITRVTPHSDDFGDYEMSWGYSPLSGYLFSLNMK